MDRRSFLRVLPLAPLVALGQLGAAAPPSLVFHQEDVEWWGAYDEDGRLLAFARDPVWLADPPLRGRWIDIRPLGFPRGGRL